MSGKRGGGRFSPICEEEEGRREEKKPIITMRGGKERRGE